MENSKSVTAILRARDVNFTSSFSKASNMLSRFQGVTGKTPSLASRAGTSIKSMATAMGIVKVAAAATTLVVGNFQKALNRMDTMQNFNRNMTRITGSSAKANDILNELKETTKGTAYGLDAAAKSTMSFANSNIPLKKSTQYTMDWMDAISAYGDGTNATYEQVMLQLQQMVSKGKANLGDLKSAMEAGVPVTQMLAQAMGKSTQEITDDISNGKISAQEFMDKMHEAFTNGAGDFKAIAGEAKNAGNSWRGTIDNMKAAVSRGLVAMIEKFDLATKKLTGSSLKEIIADIGKSFETNLGKIGDAISTVVEFVQPYWIRFTDMLKSVKQPVSDAVNAVRDALSKMYSKFDQTQSISSFKGVMDIVGQAITKFAGYVERNADKIAVLISKLPRLLAGFMALKAIRSVTNVFVGFAAELTGKVGGALETLNKMNTNVSQKFIAPLISTLQSGMGSIGSTLSIFGSQFQSSFSSAMGNLNTTPAQAAFQALGSSISYTFPSIARFSTALQSAKSKLGLFAINLKNPMIGLTNLGASMRSFTGIGNTFGAALLTPIKGVGLGFKAMGTMAISAIRGLTTAMLSNPITAILVGITATIALVATAWKNNFMNIQGVFKSFSGGIVKSLTSLKSLFKGMDTVIKPLGTALKVVAGIIGGVFMFAIAGIVDAFRLLVTNVMTVVRGFMILGSSAKMAAKAFSGDWKGAGKEFDNIKDQIGNVIDGYKNLANDSAIKHTIESTKELGKETEKVGKVHSLSVDKMNSSLESYNSKLEESKSKMEQAFTPENTSARMLDYFKNANTIVQNYSEKRQKIVAQSNEIIKNSEGESDEERLKASNKASKKMMDSLGSSNTAMLSLHKEYSEMLKNNKDAEGNALTEEQRKAMADQNEAIRQGLMEQEQLYINAAQTRIANGEKLSQKEIEGLVTNMSTLYNNKLEVINENETKISELKKQRDATSKESEKQLFTEQIQNLQAQNEKMKAEHSKYGDDVIALFDQNGKLQHQKLYESLQAMGGVTNEQLTSMFQSYVDHGASIDNQMMLMGQALKVRGVQGSDNLIAALKSKDYNAVAASMTDEVKAGISNLPPEMFKNGASGKDKFIEALKGGKYDEAGKQLVDKTNKGSKSKEGETEKTGEGIGNKSKKGIESKKDAHEKTGGKNANAYNTGIEKKEPMAKKSGQSLANQSKTGASSVSFDGVGSAMAEGVAGGITSSTGVAVGAMASLVNKVNAEARKTAKIHSPSRLLRDEVGQWLAKGVAVGIEEHTPEAIATARNLVDGIHQEMKKANDLVFSVDARSNGLTVTHEVETANVSMFSAIVEKMDQLIDKKFNMVLDTGTLIGELAPGIDNEIGNAANKKGRWG